MKRVVNELSTKNVNFRHCLFTEPLSENYYQRKKKHAHSRCELFYLVRGDVRYVVGDEKYQLNKHDLIFLPAGTQHYVEILSNSPFELYMLFFEAETIKNGFFLKEPRVFEKVNCAKDTKLLDVFVKFDYYYEHLNRKDCEDIAICLLKELGYNMQIMLSNTPAKKAVVSKDALITKALKYIDENLCNIQSVNEIAQHLYVSKGYFFKLFYENMQTTPKKYILIKRLQLAQRLLGKGEKPTAVALECGFASYCTFFKWYVDYFGYSPSNINKSD